MSFSSVSELADEIAAVAPRQLFSSPEALASVANHWSERHRFWHGPAHLRELLAGITASTSGEERDVLVVAAIYHDAIYDPRAADNEEASAILLQRDAADASHPAIRQAVEIIVESNWSEPPVSRLGRRFFELDARQLSDECPLAERLAYERAIFREYQWVPWRTYATNARNSCASGEKVSRASPWRRGVSRAPRRSPAADRGLSRQLRSLSHRHLSILRQAEQSFDKVIVALGLNRRRRRGSVEERHARVADQLRFHEVAAFSGLLSQYLDSLDVPATVLRGVRDGTDLEAELRYARFLNELRPGTSVVWIGCEPELQHISSSAVRELGRHRAHAGNRYVPDAATIYGVDHFEIT
jgi:phosphopantetheine adenylyltransferase/predicted metal-dependent HD superfamily phosphohydrolase